MGMKEPEFKIESLPGETEESRVVELRGPFTLKTVAEFQSIVREAGKPLTVIDLSRVPYMDSAALGSVLGFHISCQNRGIHYAITGASDRLMTIFRVAGVESLLFFAPSVAEAEGRSRSTSVS